jgi:hypothetical protein
MAAVGSTEEIKIDPATSAHAFDEFMSTMRTAAIRGFGGSIPNRGWRFSNFRHNARISTRR